MGEEKQPVLSKATVSAVLALIIHFYTLGAISFNITLPTWYIPILFGVATLYFTGRILEEKPSSFGIKPFVIRTILVITGLIGTLTWLALTIVIPEYWIGYITYVVAYYIPVSAKLVREG